MLFRSPLAAGRWLLAAGRWPLAAGRWPLAAGRWSVGDLILENGYLYGRPEWESIIGPTSTLIRLPLEFRFGNILKRYTACDIQSML